MKPFKIFKFEVEIEFKNFRYQFLFQGVIFVSVAMSELFPRET